MAVARATIIALAVLMAAAVTLVSAQDDSACVQMLSAEACYGLTAAPGTLVPCVWSGTACSGDPCRTQPPSTCSDTPNCLLTNWTNQRLCISQSLLCNRLDKTTCPKFPQCAVRANSYCDMVPPPGNSTNTVQCEINFPTWSVALLIMWICIMAILGFIIFLVVKKSKQAAIKGVERQEVVVDSMQIRDNFQLHQPLSQ